MWRFDNSIFSFARVFFFFQWCLMGNEINEMRKALTQDQIVTFLRNIYQKY